MIDSQDYFGPILLHGWTTSILHSCITRAGLWVGRAGPLPRAMTSRGRRKGSHRPATRSTVAWWFSHLHRKRVAKDFFSLVVLALAYSDVFWCLHMYIHIMLCLLLQILLVAALDIKTRDVPTVSSINLLLSEYCKASNFFCNFLCTGEGGGGRQLFALTRLSQGQRPALCITLTLNQINFTLHCGNKSSNSVYSRLALKLCTCIANFVMY
jgi:hypothetical protein